MEPDSSPNPSTHDGPNSNPDSTASLLSAAGIARFRTTTDGTIVDANNAFTALVGIDHSDLLESPFSRLVVEDEAVTALTAAERNPASSTLSVRTAAGTTVACDVHVIATDDNGKTMIDGIIEQPSDTSTAATSASDLAYGKTFEALADALPDGIIVLDTNSDIQYANPAVERILGFSPDDLVGSSKVTIIPSRLQQTHLDALERYLQTGERNLDWTYVELPGQHEAGHEVPLGVSLNDFTYEGNRYFVGLFRDISPRKDAERALREKVTQLEAVNYLGQQALESPDPDELLESVVQTVGPALGIDCCLVFEVKPTTPAGDHYALTARADVGCDAAVLENEATTDVSCSEPALLAERTLRSDEPIVVDSFEADDKAEYSPVLADSDIERGIGVTIGPNDDPWGVLAVYDGREREFATHDVEFVVSAATVLATGIERQQYEHRLNELVDELEASNERLEQFAYAASHDLQEPLRMVTSYLQLIENRYVTALDEEGEEFIRYAVDGAERMRAMIDGLLEYSRVDTQGASFEPVDLETVFDDVMMDLEVKIEDSNAEITTASLPTVYGDTSQLRQLLQNLLSNAIEYSGDGPPEIAVSATRDGRLWTVSVADDGIGIDPAETDRVFQVFQRLHSREEYDGTGIGLALCRRIVERHGGRIWIESEPGDGTTVSFTIPAATAINRDV